MVTYCSRKFNGSLTVEEKCPSKHSLSSKFDFTIGWCHVEEINNKGNVTMIVATPMIIIPTSNCSNIKKECESVIYIFLECTVVTQIKNCPDLVVLLF